MARWQSPQNSALLGTGSSADQPKDVHESAAMAAFAPGVGRQAQTGEPTTTRSKAETSIITGSMLALSPDRAFRAPTRYIPILL